MSEEPIKPYGFVLILRGLAEAAIMLDDHPAALKVLVVMAEYMSQKAECRISMETIAARLGISRPAVSKHVKLLAEREFIYMDAFPGKTPRFAMNLDGLEEERRNIAAVKARRLDRSHRRRGHVWSEEREDGVQYELVDDADGSYEVAWYRRIDGAEVVTSEVTGQTLDTSCVPVTSEVTTPVTSEVTTPETPEVSTPVTSEVSRRNLLRDLVRGPLKKGGSEGVADAPPRPASAEVKEFPLPPRSQEIVRDAEGREVIDFG